MEKETWINQGTKKLTVDDLTMKVGDGKVKFAGFGLIQKTRRPA